MSFETSGVYDEMQEINKSLKSVMERLDNIEQDSCKKEHTQRRPHTGERETPSGSNSSNTLLGAYSQGHDSGHPRPTSVQPLDTVNAPGIDIQGEFAAIKESLQRIKLPAELRLNDSNKQGIKRQDHPLANVITKSARYAETIFKQLSTVDSDEIDPQLENILKINVAHMKYLQDEYAALMVQGTFDPITSRLFRSLQRNNSPLNPEHVGILQSAATISAAAAGSRPQEEYSHRGTSSYTRGGYRGGFSQGYGYERRGRGYDTFQRFQRGIGHHTGRGYNNTFNNAGANNNASQYDG